MTQNLSAETRTMRKTLFLEAFAASGVLKEACEAADVSRQAVMWWRETDPDFDALYKDCLEEANDIVRSEIHRRAFGYPEPLTYRGRKTGDFIERYSDTALALLARRLPEFREQHSIELTTDVAEVRERFLSRLEEMASRLALEADGGGAADSRDD